MLETLLHANILQLFLLTMMTLIVLAAIFNGIEECIRAWRCPGGRKPDEPQ